MAVLEVAVAIHQQVPWFQVPVNDLHGMQRGFMLVRFYDGTVELALVSRTIQCR